MDGSATSTAFSSSLGFALLGLALLTIVSFWRIYSKAGEAGWKCLIPIYGAVVLQRILGRPGWWVLLLLVPVVNLVISLVECADLARVFGKGIGFALGLIFLGPLFLMVLAFGPAQYVGAGPSAAPPVRKAA